MKKMINKISYKEMGYFFLYLILLGGIMKVIFDSHQLLSKNYKIDVRELVRIDTFVQQGKTDYLYSGKGSKKGYELKSNNGYSFSITNSAFDGVVEREELEGHLKHHGLRFIVYSNQKTRDKYLNSKLPIGINVLQVEIGGKRYIDIEKGNTKARRKIAIGVFVGVILIVLYAAWLIKRTSFSFRPFRVFSIFK